ncbi:hypothetical protein [Synechocystis sp. PCC 7509]|uniref:hypothetical protein n=1 Tax=Synechocystis sp. PCC 7509 TaxID=927677 RepID=UPI0002ABBA25|nr:hypothetical protein [Synechocystis sp. PCC 7509]
MALPRAWLVLPILGLTFWYGSDVASDRILSRPYGTVAQLEADAQLEVKLSVTIVVIKAEIDKELGFTTVQVKNTNPVLTSLEFQFPVTEFAQVESAISQELGLSIAEVRKLVRYRVRND